MKILQYFKNGQSGNLKLWCLNYFVVMWEEFDFVVLRENTFSFGNFERKSYSRHLVC